MKLKHHILVSSLALLCLIIVGSSKRSQTSDSIRWGERALIWDDFPVIKTIEGGFQARIYSKIQFKGDRDARSLRIYAEMIPSRSGKIKHAEHNQLLLHEQNHFNITEYHARLFRKRVIAIGSENLSNSDLQTLGKEYTAQDDEMQLQYDKETDHNRDWDRQKYWEVYIAGLLRETAHYDEEDIYHYQEFTNEKTDWFRKVQLTIDGALKPSYPENKRNSKFGEVYHVTYKKDSTVIDYYKNGKTINGGHFGASRCVLIHSNSGKFEKHLYKSNGKFHTTSVLAPITKVAMDHVGNMLHTYYDDNGKQVSQDGIFISKGEWNQEQSSYYYSFYNEEGNRMNITNEVYYELREIDDNRFTRSIACYDQQGNPTLDDDFVFKYEYEFNDDFSIRRIKAFGLDGNPAVHTIGHNRRFEYDNFGNPVQISFWNGTNSKAVDEFGIHSYTYIYDKQGNTTDIKKFNLRNIASNGLEEYHQEVYLYDSLNRKIFSANYHPNYVLRFDEEYNGAEFNEYLDDSLIRTTNRNAYGNPADNKLGIAITKNYLDNSGRVIKREFYNKDGNWAKTQDGVTILKLDYDERGNLIEKTTYDSLGKPIPWEEDVAMCRWEYDSNNNKTKTAYFTSDGSLANATQGVTYNFFKEDLENGMSEISYFDKYMNPTVFDGIHKKLYLDNRYGQDSLHISYDIHNNIIKGPNVLKYIYDENGLLQEEAFFNENLQPTLNTMGIHKTKYIRDKDYRIVEHHSIGKQGEAINNIQGVSKIKSILNSSGFVQAYAYFDKDDHPVLGPEGFHRAENHYNDMDKLVRFSTYGTDQNLIANEEGIADIVFQVNESGQILRISYYDVQGELVNDPDGVAEYLYRPTLNGLFYYENQLDSEGREVSKEEKEEV